MLLKFSGVELLIKSGYNDPVKWSISAIIDFLFNNAFFLSTHLIYN